MKVKTWEDVEDALFDGSKDEIKKLKCPECGGALTFVFNEKFMSSILSCDGCKTVTRANGVHYIPNAVKYFGKEMMLGREE